MKRRCHKYCGELDFRDAPLGSGTLGDITVNGEPGAISSEWRVGHILTTHVVLDWPHPPSTGWMSHDDYHETYVGRYGTESHDLRCSDRAGYLGLQSIGLVPCDECVPACNP
jgi:hypothetical protein